MRARLGISPIGWSNDDLPELGGATPLWERTGDVPATVFSY